MVCSTSVFCLPTTLMTLRSLGLGDHYLHLNEEAGLPWSRVAAQTTALLGGEGGPASEASDLCGAACGCHEGSNQHQRLACSAIPSGLMVTAQQEPNRSKSPACSQLNSNSIHSFFSLLQKFLHSHRND